MRDARRKPKDSHRLFVRRANSNPGESKELEGATGKSRSAEFVAKIQPPQKNAPTMTIAQTMRHRIRGCIACVPLAVMYMLLVTLVVTTPLSVEQV